VSSPDVSCIWLSVIGWKTEAPINGQLQRHRSLLDGGGKLLTRKDGEAKTIWIGVWVDDVEAMFRMITAAGVKTDPPVTRDFGVEMLNVDDPYGYSWGFMRRV
jgi:uncharacterized glyoxalase superfamily protein PhnB